MMILAPDLHLRPTVPRCRTETEEEWFNLQKETLEFLYSFEEPVYFVGDIFHHWNPGWRMVDLFLSYALKHETYVMMGNHDARNNILDPNSGYGIIDRIATEQHDTLHNIGDFYAYVPYGEEEVKGCKNSDFLFIHRLVVQSNSDDFPRAETITARALLEKYPDYKYIITGDNHSHFIYEKDGRYVFNAGSMTKQSIKFKDEPRQCIRLGLLNVTTANSKHETFTLGSIDALDMPDKGELVDDTYIVLEHGREDRYNQLVEALKQDGEVSFDFKSNVFTNTRWNVLSKGAQDYVKGVLP